MKILKKIVKRIIIAFSVIYTFDLILCNAEIFIPINIVTITVGTLLGPIGIVALIVVFLTL